MDFFKNLEELCEKKNSLLCVGLDPRIDDQDKRAPKEKILEANKKLIEQTAEYAVCYKPNIAFYEAYGPVGMEALEESLKLIPDDIPVLMDAKRSDIGSTAEAYAKSIFSYYNADAVTINPYMGYDSAKPFLDYEGKGMFALCRTSNPSASRIQDLSVDDASGEYEELFISIARECTSWDKRVGLVVAGNDPEALKLIRASFPDVWILAPGIGTQGGNIGDAVKAGLRKDGKGILPVVVRSISNASDPAQKAKEYRDELNKARKEAMEEIKITSSVSEHDKILEMEKQEVLKGLIDTECFKVGEFILKSGEKSPFYIDLRRIISSPFLLAKVAKAYISLLTDLKFDRIAGIPVAALPMASAVSLETGIPMIYPRIPLKKHGSGNVIEGEYKKGERIVLLDDLITTGKSKIEAIEVLRSEGLEVVDLVVLLERGRQGRKDMEALGVNLHRWADVSELFLKCKELGVVDDNQLKEMQEYASK